VDKLVTDNFLINDELLKICFKKE